jgi:proline dehydrogenase
MRPWQQLMIGLALSSRVERFMQRNAAASQLARQFVAGDTVEAAVATARRLRDEGFRASLFYLGEYVSDPALVELTVAEKTAVAAALGRAGLDVHVSADPTQLGYMIDDATGRANMLRVGRAIAAQPRSGWNCLMLDMEDYGLVERTLALRAALAQAGIPAAQTLQAYLRRSEGDLRALMDGGDGAQPAPAVRLVKGAFVDRSARAWPRRRDIDRNYLALAAVMLAPEARAAGFRPVFGTHDERMIRPILALAKQHGWAAADFEFEMLHGVRPALQRQLRDEGWTVRLYLPFGQAWWPYAVRRVGESPRNARLLLRAVIGR